jgi:hypothetical protein
MKRLPFLLPLILLAAACGGYRTFPQSITVPVGETATAHVGYAPYGGSERPVVCLSSDNNVMALSQGNDFTVTIQGLHPGVAYIQPVENPSLRLVTVTVFECPPLTIQPSASLVESRVGQPLFLSVATSGTQEIKTVWLLENPPGSWTIVNANGKSFRFTPNASGTYHFRVEYNDRCGIVTTDIRVIASTRTRAVRH